VNVGINVGSVIDNVDFSDGSNDDVIVEGSLVGAMVGSIEGSDVVGSDVGEIVGASLVGAMVGSTEGSDEVGSDVVYNDGSNVGSNVGSTVVGSNVGSTVVGSNVGSNVGLFVVGSNVLSTVGSNEGPLSVFTTNPIISKNIIDMMNTVDLIVRFIKLTVKCTVNIS
jgi:hypothetical protein